MPLLTHVHDLRIINVLQIRQVIARTCNDLKKPVFRIVLHTYRL